MESESGSAESSLQYLYSSSGRWIAFRKDKYVFDTNGKWVGWLPWEDQQVVDVEGGYLGTIFPGDGLYRVLNRKYREYPGYPGYPGFAGRSPLPPATADVNELGRG